MKYLMVFRSDILFKNINLGIYFLTIQSDFNAKSPIVIYSKDIATNAINVANK